MIPESYKVRVVLTVAVGAFGGGVVLSVEEGLEDKGVLGDMKEYGSCIEDIFHGGTEIPKAGVYSFTGYANYKQYGDGFDFSYTGERYLVILSQ